MKWKFLLLWVLAALPGWSQPGGGGGLLVGGLYGQVAGRLVPLDSAAVQVRQFVLRDAAALQAYQTHQPYRQAWYPVVDVDGSYASYPTRYLRSLFDTHHAAVGPEVPVTWYELAGAAARILLPSQEPQRLQLVYRSDTMVVDVSNLLPENGAGFRSHLDSLVVLPGYFGLSLTQRPAPGTAVLNAADTLGNRRSRRGYSLTPSRLAELQALRYLDYRPTGRVGLPPLPPVAVLRYWALATRLPPQQALTLLAQAQAAGVPLNDARTNLLRAYCARGLGQPGLAEQYLTQAIDLTPSLAYQNPQASSDLARLREAYTQRLALRLRERRTTQALADYDSLAALDLANYKGRELPYLAETLQQARAARLAFRTDSLHEASAYRATITRLRADLEPNLRTMWRCRLGGTDPEQVHQLAKAEYYCGEVAQAYQHWYVLLLQGNIDYAYYLRYFTTLLAQHPGQPELLLCRALTYKTDDYTPLTLPERAAALRDLQQAERARPTDFRAAYFRAQVYAAAGQMPLAVTEMGRAIAKNAALPALYRVRHELRVQLHQAQEFSREDPDYVRYSDLCTNGY
jgi:tetratricopeptide (TPR) repeat protein